MGIVYMKSKRYNKAADNLDFGQRQLQSNHDIPYLTGVYQALAGSRESRDLQSAKIPGFSKLKSRDFLLLCFGPLGTLFSHASIFLLHIFSPTITLFIDGKGTTHKDKYKYTILTGKQFEETFENAQWRKVKQMQPM